MTSSNITNVVFLVITMYQQQCFLPAYEVAVAEANALYHDRLHIQLVPLTRPDLLSCLAVTANVADISAAFYYRNLSEKQASVFISPSMSFF